MSKIVWLVGVGGIFYSQISVIRCNAVQSEVGSKKSQRRGSERTLVQMLMFSCFGLVGLVNLCLATTMEYGVTRDIYANSTADNPSILSYPYMR